MFKANKSIIRPKYVDNKVDRRREIARQHAKEKDYEEEGYPKEIKMGEILMPPYLWFMDSESTPGLKWLVGGKRQPVNTKKRRTRKYP